MTVRQTVRRVFYRVYWAYTWGGICLCTVMALLGLAAVLFEETNRWMVAGTIGAMAAILATTTVLHRAVGAVMVAVFCILVAGFFFYISVPLFWGPFAAIAAVEIAALSWVRPGRRLVPPDPLALGHRRT